jgi:hypothetical protein
MNIHGTDDIRALDPHRPLSSYERRILDTLLGLEFPGVAELRAQADTVVAYAECACGCRSALLNVGSEVTPVSTAKRMPVEGWGVDSDGASIYFLLHVIDGYLAELEIQREDSKPIQGFPSATDVKPHVR